MNKLSIFAFLTAATLSGTSFADFGDEVAHLPKAPSWTYSVKGEVLVGAVGNDYCNMQTGEICDGANVLITGQPALVIYNNMSQVGVNGLKTSPGIECHQDVKTKATKCLFHVEKNGPVAGETPWISD